MYIHVSVNVRPIFGKGSRKNGILLMSVLLWRGSAGVKAVPFRKRELFFYTFFSDGEVPTAVKLDEGVPGVGHYHYYFFFSASLNPSEKLLKRPVMFEPNKDSRGTKTFQLYVQLCFRKAIQIYPLYMAVLFWYLEKSYLSSVQ